MKPGSGRYTAGHAGVRAFVVASLSVIFVLVLLSLPPFSPPPSSLSSSFPPPPPLFCFVSLLSSLSLPSPPLPLFTPYSCSPPDCSLVRRLAHPGRLAQPQNVSVNGDGGVVHDLSGKTGRPATVVSRHNRPSPERCLYEQVLQDCVLVLRMMPTFVFTGTQAAKQAH
jgi:hypothetical protein